MGRGKASNYIPSIYTDIFWLCMRFVGAYHDSLLQMPSGMHHIHGKWKGGRGSTEINRILEYILASSNLFLC